MEYQCQRLRRDFYRAIGRWCVDLGCSNRIIGSGKLLAISFEGEIIMTALLAAAQQVPRQLRQLIAFCALGLLFTQACGAPQVSVHDPVMAKEGDTYYLFSTGPGITFYSSQNMRDWHAEGRIFE